MDEPEDVTAEDDGTRERLERMIDEILEDEIRLLWG